MKFDEKLKAFSQGKWFILFLIIVPSCLLMAVDKQAMVIQAPQIRNEFHFSIVEMTEIIAASTWAYAFFQLPAGMLCERFGSMLMLAIACLTWSFFVLLIPFSSTIIGFLAFRFMMGFGQSPDWIASIMIIHKKFQTEQKGKANSILLSALYLGTVIGGPISLWITAHSRWEDSFFVFGVLGIFLSLFIFLVWRKSRPDIDLPSQGKEIQETAPSVPGYRRILRSSQVISIGLSYFFVVGIQSFFNTLLPMYLIDVRHMSLVSMGWIASLPFLFLYVSVVVNGVISDYIIKKTKSPWYARVPMGVAGLSGGAIFLFSALSTTETWPMMTCLCMSLFMVGLAQVSVWSSIHDISPIGSGRITGWTQFLGNLAGGVVPVICSFIARYGSGWNEVRYLIVASGVCGVVAFLFIRPQHPITYDSLNNESITIS